MSILDIVIQLLTTPAILIGLFALLGLLLQKKTVTQVVLGTIKTILGFLMLNVGIGAFVGPMKSFESLFRLAFGFEGLFLGDNVAVGAMMIEIGTQVGLVMVLGFLVNILVARFTPFKWIYLTGHKAWAMAGGIAFALITLGVSGAPLVAIGAVVLGLYMAIQPWITQPYMREIIGSDDYGFGHTYGSLAWLSGLLGKVFGKKEQNIEKVKLPETLESFRDIALTLSLIMILLFAIPTIINSAPALEMAGSQNIVQWIVIQSLTATVGFLVILQGVRMFIGELIPAFRGIAEKLVPGAKPALDCPVVYPFAPTAVLLGFLVGFVGWLLGMGACVLLGLDYIPVPSLMPVVFGCTTAAVFGNATGGTRGTIIAALVIGAIWPILGSLFYTVLPFADYGVTGTGLLTWDIYIVVLLIKLVGALFGR